MQKHALACLFGSVVVGVVCSMYGSRIDRKDMQGHALASLSWFCRR